MKIHSFCIFIHFSAARPRLRAPEFWPEHTTMKKFFAFFENLCLTNDPECGIIQSERTKEVHKMYWVLIKATERTVAMTAYKEDAFWIAANYPQECIVRYTD